MTIENQSEFLRALLSVSGDCIKLIDLEGNLRFMSEGGQVVMEVDDFSKVEGCYWPDFWVGHENPKAKQAIEEAKAGRRAEFEGFARTAKGSPRWWRVVVAPVNGADGKPAQLLSISTDITEERRKASLLRESEGIFSVLVNSIPQMAWMTDGEGTINWYNQRWYEYTGIDPGKEMKGADWKTLYHPDHIEEVLSCHREAVKSGESWEHSFPILGADGNYRWFLTRAVPLRDEDGNVLRWIGTNTDVNDVREAVAQQRALMQELQHRVKNTLAIVQAIARQSFKDTASKAANADFFSRLVALGEAHDRLLKQDWASADVGPLVRGTVKVFNTAENSRVKVKGPPLRLAPKPALALALVVHELGNNASKYGSLSNDSGHVEINWDCVGEGDDRKFVFNWKESGGPKVRAPHRRGLGSLLIEQGLGTPFGGSVKLDYPADGVAYTIEAPLLAIREQAAGSLA